MARVRLTKRVLEAMSAALTAMSAGEGPGVGDWPEEVSALDMDRAETWVAQELALRRPTSGREE